MTIGQLAEKLGLTAHTLRYYEKIGLIRHVDRVGARRSYTAKDVVWLQFILRLKGTGMPLKQIRIYAEMRYAGDATLHERKAMLISHRHVLETNIRRLQMHMGALDEKIAVYERLEDEYESVRAGIEKAGRN